MKSLPLWPQSVPLHQFPSLCADISVDTLVVGSGLMGVTAAYLLARSGVKVALIDRDKIASGDTSYTTAHLTAVMDTRLKDLVDTFGATGARALWDAGEAAIDQIREIAAECSIDCHLHSVPGYLHLPDTGSDADITSLQDEAELAQTLQIDAQYVHQVPFFQTPGIRFANQARFHPLKYLAALVKEVQRLGGQVFEETNAGEFSDDGKTIRCGNYKIHAARTVIATHTPITGNSGLLSATLFQTKLALYTSYVVCAKVPKFAVPDCLYWDTADPYHYLRLQPDEQFDYLIYGGKDHKTGQAVDTVGIFLELESQLIALLRQRHVEGEIVARWSGQVVETHDGAPYIGENTPTQFVATGFAGNGMTFGTLAAMMASDWATGRKNPWSDLLSPARKKIASSLVDYLKENVDYPYYLIKDRLLAAEGTSLNDVKPGEGKILRIDGQRIAVYHHPSGNLTKLSPVCTHLGCIVHWNDAESSWDCPCHGSRFKPGGEVLSGPAETPLTRK